MSTDPLIAAPRPLSRAPGGSVVVPLPARRIGPSRRGRPVDANHAADPGVTPSSIAQIADYRSARRGPADAAPRAARPASAPRRQRLPSLPAGLEAHAVELASLLRDHVDAQLELIRTQAPEL